MSVKELLTLPSLSLSSKEFNKLLTSLIKSLFLQTIEPILTLPTSDFMRNFTTRLNNIFNAFLPTSLLENDSFLKEKALIEKDIFTNDYTHIKNLCSSSYLSYISKEKNKKLNNFTYLSSFHPHCSKNLIAYHDCKHKGRLINVYDNFSVKYIVCVKCQSVYISSYISMYCDDCCLPFTSTYLSALDAKNIPITVSNPHCNGAIPKQLRCEKCNSRLWLTNNRMIYCKKCKEANNIEDMQYDCDICHTKYKSDVIEYFPFESEKINRAILTAIIKKKIARPLEYKCSCEIKETDEYHHSDECNGQMVFGDIYRESDILICNKCYRFFEIYNYEWKCPLCKTMFITTNLNYDYKSNKHKRTKHERNLTINFQNCSAIINDGTSTQMINNSTAKQFNKIMSMAMSPNMNFEESMTGNNTKRGKFARSKSVAMKSYDVAVPKEVSSSKKKRDMDIKSKIGILDYDKNKEDIFDKVHRTFIDQSPKKKIVFKDDEENEIKKEIIAQFNIDDYIVQSEAPELNIQNVCHKDNSNIKYIIKTFNFETEKELKVFGTNINNIIKQEANSKDKDILLFIYGMNILSNQSAIVILENFTSSLNYEIQKRVIQKKIFTQAELQSLIVMLVSAVQMQKRNIVDVVPWNILLCDDNKFKLSDEELGEMNYNVSEEIQKTFTFEDDDEVRRIGFVVVYAATQNIESIVKIKLMQKENDVYVEICKNVKNNYTRDFVRMISLMILKKEEKRMKMDDLVDIVNDWK